MPRPAPSVAAIAAIAAVVAMTVTVASDSAEATRCKRYTFETGPVVRCR